MDPAVGEGVLLYSLLSHLPKTQQVEVWGFETDTNAYQKALIRLKSKFSQVKISIKEKDFLESALRNSLIKYDIIVANPPYIRTKSLSNNTRILLRQMGLTGHVDIYHAFVFGILKALRTDGVVAMILPNKFMMTKSGLNVRKLMSEFLHLKHIWDLGDTKMFNAAILPSVVLAKGQDCKSAEKTAFTSVYETREKPSFNANSIIEVFKKEGVVQVSNGRCFTVCQGTLVNEGVWRNSTVHSDKWLNTVNSKTWSRFGDVGKIRVGVKTCADKIFIRSNWGTADKRPELLYPVITHHLARRFHAIKEQQWILYPHENICGKRQVVNLKFYPRSKKYLAQHRLKLESRKYIIEAGRKWYEIWVPHDPGAWNKTKLVFRDISERPCFWIDFNGSIVNGDCYWMVCNKGKDELLLWLLAAIGNSTFIESFYDNMFNNKLYSGRRRFIKQYVEQFPLPNPSTNLAKHIIKLTQHVYHHIEDYVKIYPDIDKLIWKSFGFKEAFQ